MDCQSAGPLSPLADSDTPAIVARAVWFAQALTERGGTALVVRPAPSAGDVEPLDDSALDRLAACWQAVGRATLAHGVRTALHVDFLFALRRDNALDRLLDRTDPELVGLALDTGEGPHPAASALLAGYLVQRELRPIVETATETSHA